MNITTVAANAAAGCEDNKVRKTKGEQADHEVGVGGLNLSEQFSGHFKFIQLNFFFFLK